MTKYNTKIAGTAHEVVNAQGGQSIKFVPEMELVGLLANGLDGHFYETESDREKRLVELIKQVGKKDPELVAKALVYARTVMGQRSVTHVGAVAALSVLSGSPLASRFFTKRDRKENRGGIIFRLDDMLEIIAYYFLRNADKPLPNSIKRGFKRVLETADTYELAKYQGKGKAISMVDIVNLIHPSPSKANGTVTIPKSLYMKSIKGTKFDPKSPKFKPIYANIATYTEEGAIVPTMHALVLGLLKQFNTSEDKNTKAGQVVAEKVKSGEITKEEAEVELKEAKGENWKQLITDGTLGYLALLRNLRNIVNDTTDEVYQAALAMLVDEKRVRKSLVFPHQIDIAFEVLLHEDKVPMARRVSLLTAVSKAYELAVPNLTELFTNGRTAVVVDTSTSMRQNPVSMLINSKATSINSYAVDKASLIGATLVKGIGADLYSFDSDCRKMQYNPLDSINTIKNMIVQNTNGGNTIFESIFRALNGKYDRVFVISDMQGGDGILRYSSYQSYIKTYGQPTVYSIDLKGYGNTMFKQSDKLINLFGYGSDIYEMIKSAEINPKAILDEIRKIVI